MVHDTPASVFCVLLYWEIYRHFLPGFWFPSSSCGSEKSSQELILASSITSRCFREVPYGSHVGVPSTFLILLYCKVYGYFFQKFWFLLSLRVYLVPIFCLWVGNTLGMSYVLPFSIPSCCVHGVPRGIDSGILSALWVHFQEFWFLPPFRIYSILLFCLWVGNTLNGFTMMTPAFRPFRTLTQL